MAAFRSRLVENPATAQFKSRRVAALYTYWSTRPGNGLPSRRDIDPADMKPLLPYLMIVDLIGTPMRVRYRLVGTQVVKYSAADFTDEYLDELTFGAYDTEPVSETYRLVAKSRLPVVAEDEREWSETSTMALEYLICPLSEDGINVSQCLVIEDYFTSNWFQLDDIPPTIRH